MTPVHLLTGDDDLLLQRATERLLSELTSADAELSVETHDASELDALPELRTQSLFGGRVCVVVRGVQDVRADLKGELEDYLERPDEEAVVVLVSRGTGKVQKIARLAKQHGEVTKVDTPPDWKTAEWQSIVTGEFRRAGRKASAEAVAAILDHAGLDPSVIAVRVAQVAAATQGDAVAVDDVERVVEGHGRRSGFALADAVAERDAARAITLLRGSLEAGEAPLALLGAITFRFRQLQQARGGADVKGSPGQVKRLLGIARRNFSTGELAWCLDRIAQLDVDLKGNTDLPPDLVLELGVIDLATAREVGAPWNPLAEAAG
jgi:DNA polymerase-3 subunit delta